MKSPLLHFALLILISFLSPLYGEIDRTSFKSDHEIDQSWADPAAREDRGSAAQRKSLDNIERRLAERANYSNSDNIIFFGSIIRKLSTTSIFQLRERIEIYDTVQQLLVSTPGHAEYFGKRICEAYEPLKGPNPGGAINRAHNEMMYGFATLKNLPSPETVKVLGEMLSETWRMEPGPLESGDPGYYPPSLALSAVIGAFGELPLRVPPEVPMVMAGENPELVMVHPWQKWYAEVKSGIRTFSFVGKSDEYRFKPDGTWETLAMANPPDDATKRVKQTAQEPSPKNRSEQSKPNDHRWVWIISTAIVVSAAVLWWRISGFPRRA